MSIFSLILIGLIVMLFIRQIYYFNARLSINFAQVALGLGAIGSLVELLLLPDIENFLFFIQDLLIPLLSGLVAFVAMSIMHQATLRMQYEDILEAQFSSNKLFNDMREYFRSIEAKLSSISHRDSKSMELIEDTFESERTIIMDIKANQEIFFNKAQGMMKHIEEMLQISKKYIEEDIKEIDSVIYRHIEVLGMSEQEHFSQLLAILEESRANQSDMEKVLEPILLQTQKISEVFEKSAQGIISRTEQFYATLNDSMYDDMNHVKSNIEKVTDASGVFASEVEKTKNEVAKLHKNIVTADTHIERILDTKKVFGASLESLHKMNVQLLATEDDYKKSKSELLNIVKKIEEAEVANIDSMQDQMRELVESIHERLEYSLSELHKHYHIADSDISESVKSLMQKKQIEKYKAKD